MESWRNQPAKVWLGPQSNHMPEIPRFGFMDDGFDSMRWTRALWPRLEHPDPPLYARHFFPLRFHRIFLPRFDIQMPDATNFCETGSDAQLLVPVRAGTVGVHASSAVLGSTRNKTFCAGANDFLTPQAW
jgi:hypothetical protein